MSYFRPRVLAILPAFIPSTIISVVKPLLQLHRAGHITAKITLEFLATRRNLKWADLVILCRNTEPRYVYLLDFLRSSNIPFIYDLDDNFFELPLNSDNGRYHRSPERLAVLADYIKLANLVRVYSQPLLEKAETLNQKVEKVFGPIDWSLISSPYNNPNPKTVKIIYATSRVSDELSTMFIPALIRILNDYVGRVEAHFWGSTPSLLRDYPDVYHHSLIRNYDRFLRRFSQAGFDVGLAPLPDDVFYRSKTNNKFREYGACRIAGIYSNVDVYSTCVTDGETGLLVPNESEAWYKAMARLIEDHHLREKIKKQAREYVWRHYSQEKFEKVWWNQIQQVIVGKDILSASSDQIEDVLQTPIYLAIKARNLIRHFRRNGLSATFSLLQLHLFGFWMVFKLRLHTSAAYNIFYRKRF